MRSRRMGITNVTRFGNHQLNSLHGYNTANPSDPMLKHDPCAYARLAKQIKPGTNARAQGEHACNPHSRFQRIDATAESNDEEDDSHHKALDRCGRDKGGGTIMGWCMRTIVRAAHQHHTH